MKSFIKLMISYRKNDYFGSRNTCPQKNGASLAKLTSQEVRSGVLQVMTENQFLLGNAAKLWLHGFNSLSLDGTEIHDYFNNKYHFICYVAYAEISAKDFIVS